MTGERENEIRELMLRLPIGDARKAISHLLLEVEDERAKLAKTIAALNWYAASRGLRGERARQTLKESQ